MTMRRILKLGGGLALAGVAAAAVGSRMAGGSGAARAVAYEPTDTLKPVGEDLWIVDGEPISAMGLTVPVRMSVIRLADGTILLHSPIRHSPALAGMIDELGPVRHLVAPSIAHWKFLADWQRAYPQATTRAVPGLASRPQVRLSGLRIERELDETAPPEWTGISQHLVRGLGFVEAVLFHEPSRTLVLCDLIENLEPDKLPAITAAAARLAGACEGRPARHVRAALRLGGAQAREDIARMIALAPEKIVFVHGDWFDGDGAMRLRRAFDWL